MERPQDSPTAPALCHGEAAAPRPVLGRRNLLQSAERSVLNLREGGGKGGRCCVACTCPEGLPPWVLRLSVTKEGGQEQHGQIQ